MKNELIDRGICKCCLQLIIQLKPFQFLLLCGLFCCPSDAPKFSLQVHAISNLSYESCVYDDMMPVLFIDKFANDPILVKKFIADVQLAERTSKIRILTPAYFQRNNLYRRMNPLDFDDSEQGAVFNCVQFNKKKFSSLSSKYTDGYYSSNILQRKKNIVTKPSSTSSSATATSNNCRYFKTVVSGVVCVCV